MKHVLLATAALFVCGAAYAGQEHKPAPAMPAAAPANTAAALSASQSRASAVATGGQSRSSATGGRSESNVTVNNTAGGRGYGGGYSARNNTPDVVLPGINGGNPCGLGAGVGGSGPGAGGILSFMWEGQGCEARQEAALLANMGNTRAGIERLCESSMKVRWALRNTRQPCQVDIERWARGER